MGYWKGVARRATNVFAVVFLIFYLIHVLFALVSPPERRKAVINHSFGVGFDLNPSYGTVAVSYPNGSTIPIAKIEGDETYREMMRRLSHKPPKYLHGIPMLDLSPKFFWRNARMNLGFPATRDAGILSRMIKALRMEAERFIGQSMVAAAMSIPQIAGLDEEGVQYAFDYLNLIYIDFPFLLASPIHSSATIYAGNGLGLCANYTRPDICLEEEGHLRGSLILAISYTHNSLMASEVEIASPYWMRENTNIAELTLGYNARHENPDENYYWEKVRDTISFPIVASGVYRNVTKVMLSGDASRSSRFRQVLKEVADSVLEVVEGVIDDDPVHSAAKGVAELAKREIWRRNATRNQKYPIVSHPLDL